MIATLDRAVKLGAGEYKRPEKMDGKWSAGPVLDERVLLEYEREYLGFYATGHPTNSYPWMQLLGDTSSLNDEFAVAGGVITTVENRQTHSGKKFLTWIIDTPFTAVNCIVWEPDDAMLKAVKDGRIVIVRGKSNRRGSNNTLTVHTVVVPELYQKQYRLGILVEAPARLGPALLQIAQDHPGEELFAIKARGQTFAANVTVAVSEALVNALLAIAPTVYITETRRK